MMSVNHSGLLRHSRVFAVSAVLLLVFASLSCGRPKERDYWPTESWKRASPESAGFDSEKLLSVLRSHDLAAIGLDSLIVVRNGYILTELYRYPNAPGIPHSVNSVTKSFISTAFGIAQDRGLVGGVNKKILDYFPEYDEREADPRKKDLTVSDFLTMRTGQNWNENNVANIENSFDMMIASDNWIDLIINTPMMMNGGTAFDYNSGASHVISAILDRAAGGTEAFVREALFEPLGISGYRWKKDPQGIPAGGYGLALRSEDLARLGFLFLNDGRWDGRQIVSKRWVREATRPRTKTTGSFNSSWEYGYQWWIDPERNSHSAQGYGGQYIFVVPKLDLVIVTTANIDYRRGAELMSMIMSEIAGALVKDGPLPENASAARALAEFCASLGESPAPRPVAISAAFSRKEPTRVRFDGNDLGVASGSFALQDDGAFSFNYEFAGNGGGRCSVSLLAGVDGRFRLVDTPLPDAWYQFEFDPVPVACRVIEADADSIAFETILVGSTVGPFVYRIVVDGKNVRVVRTERLSRRSTVIKGEIVP